MIKIQVAADYALMDANSAVIIIHVMFVIHFHKDYHGVNANAS